MGVGAEPPNLLMDGVSRDSEQSQGACFVLVIRAPWWGMGPLPELRWLKWRGLRWRRSTPGEALLQPPSPQSLENLCVAGG